MSRSLDDDEMMGMLMNFWLGSTVANFSPASRDGVIQSHVNYHSVPNICMLQHRQAILRGIWYVFPPPNYLDDHKFSLWGIPCNFVEDHKQHSLSLNQRQYMSYPINDILSIAASQYYSVELQWVWILIRLTHNITYNRWRRMKVPCRSIFPTY